MSTELKIAVILNAYDKMSKPIAAAISKAQGSLNAFARKQDALADKAFKTGQQLVASGVAIAAPIYKAITAASDFETKMIDIRKQMKEDTPESVRKMTSDVFKLGKELPIATAGIQDMIAAGLRMDIPEKKIIDFTKNVTKMAVAFDMDPGEIADSMGKIANIYKIPIEDIGNFADAINYLDDNSMSKGPELIDVLQRIGGSARNLSPTSAAALASTMLTLGETSERAGSALSGMLVSLNTATSGKKSFQAGLSMLKLNPAHVQKQMSDSATAGEMLQEVFRRINELDVSKQEEALINLFGRDHGPKLTKMVTNMGELQRQMGLVKGAEKGSMDREYQKRIQGAAAQTQIFKNRLNELWVRVGTTVLPTMNKLLLSAGKWIDKLGSWIEKNPKLVEGIVKGAAAFSALAIVGGYVSFVMGGVFKVFSLTASFASVLLNPIRFLTLGKWRLLRAVVSVKNGFLAFGSTVANVFKIIRLAALNNPITAIIIGIALAAFLIYKYWDNIKAFFIRILDSVKGIFFAAFQYIKKALMFTPLGPIIMFWRPIASFFKALFELIYVIIRVTWNIIKRFILSPIVGAFKKVWEPVKSFFAGIFAWIGDKFNKFHALVSGVVKKIVAPFLAIGKTLFRAGVSIIQSIIDGITSKINSLTDKIKGVTKSIRDFFPFSPAKAGALKDIHKVRLIETIAQSVKPASLVNAVKKTTGMAFKAITGAPASFSGNSSSSAGPSFNLTINLSGTATKSDATLISAEMKKQFNSWMKEYQSSKARVAF